MEIEKLSEEIRIVQERESLGRANGPRKRRVVRVYRGSMRSTRPLSTLAPGRTQIIRNVQFRSGNSSIGSTFQTVAGLGPGSWEPGPGSWELGPSQPRKAGGAKPRRPSAQLQQPRGKERPARSRRSLSVFRTAVPLSQLRRRGRRSPGCHCASSPPASRAAQFRGSRPPQAAGTATLPRGAASAAEPHLRGSRTRRRTRSCTPCPPTWARGSWACGAPAARRCLPQPSSCCRCRPACRTGRPGAAWPRRAPEPSRAEPERWICPRRRRRRAARATGAEPGLAGGAGRGAGTGTGGLGRTSGRGGGGGGRCYF